MSDIEDSKDEASSSSEDEEPELDEGIDKFFFKTLSCLKNKDPRIYDPTVVFFPEEDPAKEIKIQENVENKDPKPVFLRDYERERVVKVMKGGGHSEDDEVAEEDLPYVVQQKNLKASFKAGLEDSDSDCDDLLKVKTKTAEEKEQEEEDYKAWLKGNKEELDDKQVEKDLKPLHDFWTKPDLDSNEQFLRDYLLNKRYQEEGEEVEDDGISEDGELLEMQENFEVEYNMRFENDSNLETKRYPRVIEGSLRRKDERRAEKRKRRRERKTLEKGKKKLEIAKKQKEKLKEFKDQVDKIKKLTGNDLLGFKDEEIFGDDDFDPDAHDKKMQELYGDAFYSAGADDLDCGNDDNEDFDELGPDNMDLDAAGSSKQSKKETRSKKKRKEKKKAFSDIMDLAKPVFDPQVHNSYQKYIDEYYGMDCEDFIDDVPCKFKYREVVPNDYGLSVEEILAADDKELDQWVSAKKIVRIRPEHVERNEVKIYKKKGQNYLLKKKILRSVYGSPEREDTADDDDTKPDLSTPKAGVSAESEGLHLSNSKIGKNKKKRAPDDSKKDIPQTDERPVSKKKKLNSETKTDGSTSSVFGQRTIDTTPSQNGYKKKKPFQNKKGNNHKAGAKKKSDPLDVSDLRLKAYDIKPKEFKKKLKFKGKT